jgi:SOS-response transcriptional repressor LexA
MSITNIIGTRNKPSYIVGFMGNLADRLNQRMSDLDMVQEQLAKAAGVSQVTIHNLSTGKSRKSRYLREIATALGVTVDWLELGDGEVDLLSGESRSLGYANTIQGPDNRGFVPVISWVQAGEWADAEDNFQPGEADEFLPCPVAHGMSTFALRIVGDSMTSPTGRSYPEGATIFVDPDQRGGVTTGDRVVAKINGESAVTFKVFIQEGDRRYLKPLNPQYPIITDEFRVLGKVIGMWLD